ncbi:RNA-binding protein [Bacillus mycoides]|uniref:RNA-binding protein n=1 Tax=Bacillus mycoides TaxID=1405 RepID=UPI0010BF238E|nr:RNA-binding protein [Bacillus mycoides]TKI35791.1 RNA-binding protein [Bacillus mycoides]
MSDKELKKEGIELAELYTDEDTLAAVNEENNQDTIHNEEEAEFKSFHSVKSLDLNVLAQMKRDRTIESGLVTFVTERLFPTKRGISERIPVLTIQIGNVVAYCPINEAGMRVPSNPQWLVGKTKPFIIEHFHETNEGNVAIVSIKKAEEILSEKLFEEVTNTKAKKAFEGKVIANNNNNRFVIVEIKGVPVIVPYSVWSHSNIRVESQVNIGETVNLIITKAKKQEDRYQFIGDKRALEQDPIERLQEIKKRRDRFVAHITGVDPIAGIFIEVAPGIQFKGVKGRNVAEPSQEDAKYRTLVTVELLNIDVAKRRGTVRIIDYPQGLQKKHNVTVVRF